MSSSEEILGQIDRTLCDHTVSSDALRCTPDPQPVPPVPVVPAVAGRMVAREAVVRRLVDDHGLTPDTAAAAVHAVETGQPTEHQHLVTAAARAVAAELAQRIGQFFDAFTRALEPMARAAAAAARQLDEALRAVGHAASSRRGGRRDRKAWQSPYGPPSRRKR
ncbi:hypothetical protein [Streptomyces sp. PAM3C]|uniref:hypothetical protein n=1 Tax=Streptomyces sp. PAM3C TaxID=2847300 RepID=UPI001C1E50EF|nr:hypothetical protein [Streptomyces sp. PAM3C]MBU5946768.1 hypothetical protein [Streptomyces sp. PAM3C]